VSQPNILQTKFRFDLYRTDVTAILIKPEHYQFNWKELTVQICHIPA